MDAVRLVAPPAGQRAPYLPAEAPLDMPVQSLREGERAAPLPFAQGSIAGRRAFVFGTALALSIVAAYEMYLVLAVGAPGSSWRIFNTDDFLPPKDPADWVKGKISDVRHSMNSNR